MFRKVQEGFGGNLRLMVVGSAPLAGHVLTFMRCSLGCLIVEGYGQTECVAGENFMKFEMIQKYNISFKN